MAGEVRMKDYIMFLTFVFSVMIFSYIQTMTKQLDRIERRLEVITPAYECAGYTYDYEVENYCTEIDSISDSLEIGKEN